MARLTQSRRVERDFTRARARLITARSFTDLLRGEAKTARPFLIACRERIDVLARPGSPAGLGYPARAIRQGDYLFVHNFAPDRLPCGDASPTKALISALGEGDPYWEHSFGKRLAKMRDTMIAELKKQADPRALGQGDVFYQYLSPRTKTVKRPKKE